MAKADDPTADSSWQQRAVDRSLTNARERAVSRSGQILEAARSLMLETDGIDFTVQDIVDRSGLSLRSFYKHFGGKDELLLALFEELLASFAEDLREEVAEHDDPLDQLRAYVAGFYGRAEVSGQHAARALGTYHVRMLAIRKDEFALALGPQMAVLREIIDVGVATGAFRHDLEADELTGLLTITLMSISQMAVLDVHLAGSPLALERVWAWCESAVCVPGSTSVGVPSRARPSATSGRSGKSRGASSTAKARSTR